MCIRDSAKAEHKPTEARRRYERAAAYPHTPFGRRAKQALGEAAVAMPCLLYTSDAADERSSVDLGGRRIIKKQQW